MFKNSSSFSYLNGFKIEVLTETSLKVQIKDEVFNFSEENKAIFASETGETVIEYSGLATDGVPTRSFAKASFTPGGSSAKHYHTSLTEDYYVFSGKGEVIVDGITHQVSAGNHIRIAPGQTHQVINSSENQPLHLLVLCQPAWQAKDFIQVTDVAPTKPRILG